MVVLVTLVICGNLESSEGCSQSVGAVSSVSVVLQNDPSVPKSVFTITEKAPTG